MAYGNSNKVCPFCEGVQTKKIQCEGIYNKSHMVLKFDSQKLVVDYVAAFCNTYKYRECPLYQFVLSNKYKGED